MVRRTALPPCVSVMVTIGGKMLFVIGMIAVVSVGSTMGMSQKGITLSTTFEHFEVSQFVRDLLADCETQFK